MCSMSHKRDTNSIYGSFALKFKESPSCVNVGGVGGRNRTPQPSKPSNKLVFGIQISTPICDEALTLIWVSFITLESYNLETL
jgi:hypothetical protein